MPAAVVPTHSDAGAAPNQSESEPESARGGVAPREQELEALLAKRDGQLAAALARVEKLEAQLLTTRP